VKDVRDVEHFMNARYPMTRLPIAPIAFLDSPSSTGSTGILGPFEPIKSVTVDNRR
jgi:hypothetical protein